MKRLFLLVTLILGCILLAINASGGFAGLSHASFDGSILSNPEPATMLLVGTGLVGLAGFRRKSKRQI